MKDLTIYTYETQGIVGEPVRLSVAAYNPDQARKALDATVYKVAHHNLQRKVDHMPRNVQKQYAEQISNPTTVYVRRFGTSKWVQTI